MAGSWNHMTTRRGRFRNNESFFGMMDTGGDCYEAAEECYGMVQVLAAELAASGFSGGRSREEWIKWAQQDYKRGLRIGGVQRPR